jgi:hypothetical protein
MTLDREWEKLKRSLDLQEEQFKNKILPRNRLTQETIDNINLQIQHIKLSLLTRRRNIASFSKIENEMNHLAVDLLTAGRMSGMEHVLVFSSELP